MTAELSVNPADAQMFVRLGRCLARTGAPEKAWSEIRRGGALAPVACATLGDIPTSVCGLRLVTTSATAVKPTATRVAGWTRATVAATTSTAQPR